MATCGYVCPACEGRGFDEQGQICTWCKAPLEINETTPSALPAITDEEWMARVHEGPCCGDEET